MISVIITNYKTWALTERCVKSVDETDYSKQIAEIIIVDDNSNETIPDYIKNHPLSKVIINEQNKGYAKSVNIGFKAATNNICLLLDSDAYLVANIGLISQDFINNPNLGLLGFNLVDENGNKTGNGEKEVNVWGLILGQQLDNLLKKAFFKKKPIESLYSCAIGVRRTAFEEVYGFDESFDFLDADHDFSMKINRSNWKMRINNKIIIFHKGGGSPQLTSKRVIRLYTNRLHLLKKYNLYKYPKLYNLIIRFRLKCELSILQCFVLFNRNDIRKLDKIKGRIEVLKIFR